VVQFYSLFVGCSVSGAKTSASTTATMIHTKATAHSIASHNSTLTVIKNFAKAKIWPQCGLKVRIFGKNFSLFWPHKFLTLAMASAYQPCDKNWS